MTVLGLELKEIDREALFDCEKQPPEVFCKKKVFLEISQNSQENTCARVPFLINLQALGLQT